MEFLSGVTKFFQDGGIFIYPIALVLAIGVAISLERWRFLNIEKKRNSKAFDDFLPLLRTDDHEKMTLFTRDSTAPVARMIGCGLDMMKVTKQRADVEQAMSEGMMETVPRLEQRTGYLAVLANVATLLGLLGTIIGLIAAFAGVAGASAAEKQQVLAAGISVAMFTTAFGLIVSIPSLVGFYLLNNRGDHIIEKMDEKSLALFNILSGLKREN